MYPLQGEQPFPRNAWYMAAWSSEVTDNLLSRTLLDVPVLLFRDENGNIAALDNRCPHRRYPLSKGSLCNGVITCNYHGYSFDGTGKCVSVPTMEKPAASHRAQAYPVREQWNWIWVWLGDPGLAEATELPDHSLVHADDEDWLFSVGGVAKINARYMLLHDNILDLTHLTYLHQKTIGSPGIANAQVTTRDINERSFVMSRETLNDSMEGVPLGKALDITGPVDRIMPQTFSAPCLHVTGPEFRSSLSGGTNPGHIFGAFRVIHGIVPETATTTHYFWGFTRNFKQDDEKITQALRNNISAAVVEDIEASEDVERMLNLPRAPVEIHSPADAPQAKGRRIIQRMLNSEA